MDLVNTCTLPGDGCDHGGWLLYAVPEVISGLRAGTACHPGLGGLQGALGTPTERELALLRRVGRTRWKVEVAVRRGSQRWLRSKPGWLWLWGWPVADPRWLRGLLWRLWGLEPPGRLRPRVSRGYQRHARRKAVRAWAGHVTDWRDRVVVTQVLAHLARSSPDGLWGAAGEGVHWAQLEVRLLTLRGSIVTCADVTCRPASTAGPARRRAGSARCRTEAHLKHGPITPHQSTYCWWG